MSYFPFVRTVLLSLGIAAPSVLFGWGPDGHRMVCQVAIDSLPSDFPSWVKDAASVDRILYVVNDPDHWRNSVDLPFRHESFPDHELDLEKLAMVGLDPASVSSFRQVFAQQFAAGYAQHRDLFPPTDPQKDKDHVDTIPGFLPWAIAEQFGRLRSSFATMRTYEELGTPAEAANARADVLYVMGILGHFVGDSSQPLHTTRFYNGWVGSNPKGYTTWKGFHSEIDSGFIVHAAITYAELAPKVTPAHAIPFAAQPGGRDPVFSVAMDFIVTTNKLVEPLYQMEKDGKLKGEGAQANPEGRAFIDQQLIAGGEMLGALWLAAWTHPEPDLFLRSELMARRAKAAAHAQP